MNIHLLFYLLYKIEVIITPQYHDNPMKPYFWVVGKFLENDNWCSVGYGWETTPDEAWKKACEYYTKHIGVEE